MLIKWVNFLEQKRRLSHAQNSEVGNCVFWATSVFHPLHSAQPHQTHASTAEDTHHVCPAARADVFLSTAGPKLIPGLQFTQLGLAGISPALMPRHPNTDQSGHFFSVNMTADAVSHKLTHEMTSLLAHGLSFLVIHITLASRKTPRRHNTMQKSRIQEPEWSQEKARAGSLG